jgi:hypothetical protein
LSYSPSPEITFWRNREYLTNELKSDSQAQGNHENEMSSFEVHYYYFIQQ